MDTLREVAEREKFKLYGELITANIYCIPKNASKVSLLNYYSENGEYVEVPLDENLLPQENAQRYFKKYAKAKAAYIHATQQLEEARGELSYLESVLHSLENSNSFEDIDDIRQELGFIWSYILSVYLDTKFSLDIEDINSKMRLRKNRSKNWIMIWQI